MLFGDLGAATHQATAAGLVDQLPGLLARWIGEGRTAGPAFDRLARLTGLADLVHAGADGGFVARHGLQPGAGEYPILGNGGVAIGEAEIGKRQPVYPAQPVHRLRLTHHLHHLAAISAGVHPQRTTDGAGNAAQELHAAEPGIARRQRNIQVERASARFDHIPFDPDLGKAAAEPNHDARYAAVADQGI